MKTYAIYEGFLPDLLKKVQTIRKKCAKYGCDFHFAEIGEEIRDVVDERVVDPVTHKHPVKKCRFVICEAEGTAVVNGWEFVASVEHTEKGNIFAKSMTDIEIPTRYRDSYPVCEHCNTNRKRKDTFIIVNKETGEFKQVGYNCLCDYTHGMSASCASYLASLKEVFAEAEEAPAFESIGWGERYFDTNEWLCYVAETVRKFGYELDGGTRARANTYWDYDHGNTAFWTNDVEATVRREMDAVGYDPESAEAKAMVESAVEWLNGQEASNDYMHNLKTAVALSACKARHFGLLASLFPTWNRELEREAKRKAEAEAGKVSEFVGKVGDRVTADVESVRCITSWESCYGGRYTPTTVYVWKITSTDGNVFTWKSQTFLDTDEPPKRITGTVKEHKTFRDVKQTELTRCKVER